MCRYCEIWSSCCRHGAFNDMSESNQRHLWYSLSHLLSIFIRQDHTYEQALEQALNFLKTFCDLNEKGYLKRVSEQDKSSFFKELVLNLHDAPPGEYLTTKRILNSINLGQV